MAATKTREATATVRVLEHITETTVFENGVAMQKEVLPGSIATLTEREASLRLQRGSAQEVDAKTATAVMDAVSQGLATKALGQPGYVLTDAGMLKLFGK